MTAAGLVSQVMASLTKIISAEMAVLKRKPSRSSVTFLMQAWSVLSWAGVAGDVLDGGAELDVVQASGSSCALRGLGLLEFRFALFIHEQPPDAAEKTIDAFDAFGVPRFDHFQRAHEHLVKPERVGAVFAQNVVGVDDVAARLGHLLPVLAEDDALVDQLEERLRRGDVAQIEKDVVPETGVEQMQHGVLDAADVQIDARRAPAPGCVPIQ